MSADTDKLQQQVKRLEVEYRTLEAQSTLFSELSEDMEQIRLDKLRKLKRAAERLARHLEESKRYEH